jgi:hypothetical protein
VAASVDMERGNAVRRIVATNLKDRRTSLGFKKNYLRTSLGFKKNYLRGDN